MIERITSHPAVLDPRRWPWIALTVLVLTGACNRIRPPSGAEVLVFKRNEHIRNRALYQSNTDGALITGRTKRYYWFGLKSKPAHRLFINLLPASRSLKVRLWEKGRAWDCNYRAAEKIPGCNLNVNIVRPGGYRIEVYLSEQDGRVDSRKEMNSAGMKYRLFVGLQGKDKLEFIKYN